MGIYAGPPSCLKVVPKDETADPVDSDEDILSDIAPITVISGWDVGEELNDLLTSEILINRRKYKSELR